MSSTQEILSGIILAIIGGLLFEYGDAIGIHIAWIGWILVPSGVGLIILGFIHKVK